MITKRTENGHCPTCNRRETIVVEYDVVTEYGPEGRTDTYSTISASCRHGHPVPSYVGERG